MGGALPNSPIQTLSGIKVAVPAAALNVASVSPGETPMAFEEIQAEIASLLIRMNEQPEDIHEMELLLREKLNEYRAFGLPLPQDLADLETLLDERLAERGQSE
jgi:hypothetical protein